MEPNAMNLLTFYGTLLLLSYVVAWPCVSPISETYSRENSIAVLQFTADISSIKSPTLFEIKDKDNQVKARITYYSNGSTNAEGVTGISITGDTSGNVKVTLNNVTVNKIGVYSLTSAGFSTQCSCLYILRTPAKPKVTVSKTPSVGESVTLTCSSTSTTTPSNHSLSLKYDWKVNNTDNPGGIKYSYTSNRDKLTVNNIVKEDAYKQFTCTATEDVTGGYTSVRSDQFSFDVYYGPDTLEFEPSETLYEKVENSSLNQVTCKASCYPQCNFTWIKTGRDKAISNTAILNFKKLQSSDAGTYTCKAERIHGFIQSKDLTLNVIYGPNNMFFNPNNTQYRYNESFDMAPITCGAKCWECSYSWTGPNLFRSSNASLYLGPLTKVMAGTYKCTARNLKHSEKISQSKQLSLEVRYGPDSVNFTNGQIEYTLNENTQLIDIKCNADCFPRCTYKWTKKGQSVSNTDTLSLGHVQRSSAGEYICRATNGDTPSKWKENRVTINIRYGPDSVNLTNGQLAYTVNESSYLSSIKCNADCFPPCLYEWTQKGQSVSNTDTLSLGHVQRSSAGEYICTATNGDTPSKWKENRVTINIRYGPDSAKVNRTSPYTTTEGDRYASVECNSDCYPNCSYIWKNVNNSSITNGRILHFDTVMKENAGDYKCFVTNSASREYSKSAESTIRVIVQYAPKVSITLSGKTMKEGGNLTLHCNGHGVPNIYNYTNLEQSFNKTVISNNNTAIDGTDKWSSLYFKSLRLDDTGTYTCTLNNGIKNRSGILNQTGSKYIMVQVSPKVLKSDLRFTGSTGDVITIKIPIYSYPKHDSLTATRYDGQAIAQDKLIIVDERVEAHFYGKPVALQGSVISLVLNDTKEEDFGNYSFILTNALNTTQVFVHVIAEGPPLAPKHFQFLFEGNIPTLVWQKDFNGGLHQYFMIQTSIAGTEIWTNLLNVSETDIRYKVNNTFYSANITGLSSGKYAARIYAYNVKGSSSIVLVETSFDIIKEIDGSKALPVGIIAGVTSAVLLVLLIGGIILFIFKRRSNKDGCKTKLNSRKHTGDDDDDNDDDDEVNTVNPMYVSADEVQVADNTYAKPIRKTKAPEMSNVYAMVDKKKKKDTKDNKNKKDKREIEGDIYENAPPAAFNDNKDKKKMKKGKEKAYDENPYENPLPDKADHKRNVNKDGLIYADLAFNEQPKGQKKLVIHGLDNMTEYVEVDFTKRADPLPDSDEEESTTKQ